MTDLRSKLQDVQSKESFLEKIARIIPGYDGYLNRDNAREIDNLLRNTLASNLDQNKVRIKNTVLNLSRSGKLFETDSIDKIEKKLEQAIGKFRSASRGYSGAFDVVKIKDDKLNQLYLFDAGLLDDVEEVAKAMAELEANSNEGADIKPAKERTSNLLDSLLKQFDEREILLKNL